MIPSTEESVRRGGDISLTLVSRDASVFWLTIAVDEERSPTLWEVLSQLESVLVVLGLRNQRERRHKAGKSAAQFPNDGAVNMVNPP
jgi:hypothetical protein